METRACARGSKAQRHVVNVATGGRRAFGALSLWLVVSSRVPRMDAFLLLVVVLRPEVGLREIAEECRNPLQRPRLGDGDDSATGISLLVATACTILLSADIAFRLLHAIFIALTCSLITLQYMTATASSDPASKGTPACPPREDSLLSSFRTPVMFTPSGLKMGAHSWEMDPKSKPDRLKWRLSLKMLSTTTGCLV
mmetsp:Transcript_24015/g.59608  ORF Transcript_24015/g.59608 Transcript_24015/m.59608 type:complete len:197 (+) Transcript_24015:41-631(+)